MRFFLYCSMIIFDNKYRIENCFSDSDEIIPLNAVQSHFTITLSIYFDAPVLFTNFLLIYVLCFLSSWLRQSLSRRFCSFFAIQPLLRGRLISASRGCCEESISIVSMQVYRDASEETRSRKESKMLKIVGLCRSARNIKVARHGQSRTGSIASTAACLQRLRK